MVEFDATMSTAKPYIPTKTKGGGVGDDQTKQQSTRFNNQGTECTIEWYSMRQDTIQPIWLPELPWWSLMLR